MFKPQDKSTKKPFRTNDHEDKGINFSFIYIQDVINLISSNVSYVEGLAAWSQTSKQMHMLIENTPAGKKAKELGGNPDDHGKNYKKVAISLSYLPTVGVSPVAFLLCLVGGIGCFGGLPGGPPPGLPVVRMGIRLFKIYKPTKELLLRNTLREREEIKNHQNEIREELYKAIGLDQEVEMTGGLNIV